MSKQKTFSQKFWEDSRGRVIVWQKPNIWLSAWFVTMALGWFAPLGWPVKILSWTSLLALIIWAVLEVTTGVNYFRRLLGLLVLLVLIVSRVIAI